MSIRSTLATTIALTLPTLATADTLLVPEEYASIPSAISAAADGDVILKAEPRPA